MLFKRHIRIVSHILCGAMKTYSIYIHLFLSFKTGPSYVCVVAKSPLYTTVIAWSLLKTIIINYWTHPQADKISSIAQIGLGISGTGGVGVGAGVRQEDGTNRAGAGNMILRSLVKSS
jgi:hypothetical protein